MASLIDQYAELMCRKAGSGDGVGRRLLDPNFGTPDFFYAMDEIKGRQILHRFDKSSGVPVYTGTYRILYKTEDMERFCLIMKRIRDMWRIDDHKYSYELEKDVLTVSQYYPGTEGRIYMKGLDEKAMERIITRYERGRRKKLGAPDESGTSEEAGTFEDGGARGESGATEERIDAPEERKKLFVTPE